MSTTDAVYKLGRLMSEILQLYILKFCPSLSSDTVRIIFDYLAMIDHAIHIHYIVHEDATSSSSSEYPFWPDWKRCTNDKMVFTPTKGDRPQLYFCQHFGGFFHSVYRCDINIGLDIVGPTSGYIEHPIRAKIKPQLMSVEIDKLQLHWVKESKNNSILTKRKRTQSVTKPQFVQIALPNSIGVIVIERSTTSISSKPFVSRIEFHRKIGIDCCPKRMKEKNDETLKTGDMHKRDFRK